MSREVCKGIGGNVFRSFEVTTIFSFMVPTAFNNNFLLLDTLDDADFKCAVFTFDLRIFANEVRTRVFAIK